MKENLELIDRLKAGEVCLLPSGGLPGLSFVSSDRTGKQALLKIKGREESKGIVSLVANLDAALVFWKPLPKRVEAVLRETWPAGLTIVYQADSRSKLLTGADDKGEYLVGLRVPQMPEATKWMYPVIREVGVLASSSVNISGQPSISDWSEAIEFATLQGLYVDSRVVALGQAARPHASASTVVKVGVGGEISILRQGNLTPDVSKFLKELS